jgi:TM2 domain-containing membrane protein YozV
MDSKITKECPFCAEKIKADAKKCKHCGELLDPVLIKKRSKLNKTDQEWSPGIAAVLSLVIPGAGQMYKGKLGSGFAWLIAVPLGYVLFIIPGVVLHIACIISAATKRN